MILDKVLNDKAHSEISGHGFRRVSENMFFTISWLKFPQQRIKPPVSNISCLWDWLSIVLELVYQKNPILCIPGPKCRVLRTGSWRGASEVPLCSSIPPTVCVRYKLSWSASGFRSASHAELVNTQQVILNELKNALIGSVWKPKLLPLKLQSRWYAYSDVMLAKHGVWV